MVHSSSPTPDTADRRPTVQSSAQTERVKLERWGRGDHASGGAQRMCCLRYHQYAQNLRTVKPHKLSHRMIIRNAEYLSGGSGSDGIVWLEIVSKTAVFET